MDVFGRMCANGMEFLKKKDIEKAGQNSQANSESSHLSICMWAEPCIYRVFPPFFS